LRFLGISALALDPQFPGAYLNLADAYRQMNREAEGEATLRRGLTLLPRAADLHHALALLLVRKGVVA
jgi:Tfp pilus assembly protein PilF